MSDSGPQPLTHHVYLPEVDGRPQKPARHHYVWTLNEAINLAAAADLLGFAWQVTAYQCPTGNEDTTEAEYQVTVWGEAMSETLSMKPKAEVGE